MNRKYNSLIVVAFIILTLIIGVISYYLRENHQLKNTILKEQHTADSLYIQGMFVEAQTAYEKALALSPQATYLIDQLQACKDSITEMKNEELFLSSQLAEVDSLIKANRFEKAISNLDTLKQNFSDTTLLSTFQRLFGTIQAKKDSLKQLHASIEEEAKTADQLIPEKDKTTKMDTQTIPKILEAKAEAKKNIELILNTLDKQFILVEGGEFFMGQQDPNIGGENWSNNEQPVHKVAVNSFFIAKYEVTQAQWEAVMGENNSKYKCEECPAEQVSWFDAQAFITKLNKLTGENYRLPTEAEWEYAARGGNKQSAFTFSSSNDINEAGWYLANSGNKPHPVGLKRPNKLGIYDMCGNVWEWCLDWYEKDYYAKSPIMNPEGPRNGQYKVLRGGSWYTAPEDSRITSRVRDVQDGRFANNGLRLVKDIKP